MKNRNSNIEVLKIISIILIVINHSVQTVIGNMNGIASLEYEVIISNFLRVGGQIGNIIFVVCSSYFLLDDNKTKAEKVIKIVIDSFLISVLFFGLLMIFKFNLDFKIIIRQFLPITYQNNWFITCYILLYLFHPYLNTIIEKIKKEAYFDILFILTIIFGGIQMIFTNSYFYTDLVGFIYIYFMVGYFKKHLHNYCLNKSINKKVAFISFLIIIISFLILNFLGIKIQFINNQILHFNCMVNPIYIIFVLSVFNIQNIHNFNNKIINYFSSMSFFIYIIHENMLCRLYLRPLLLNYILLCSKNIIICEFILSFIILVVSIIISIIYKETVSRIIFKISQSIKNILYLLYIKIKKLLLKIN